MGNYRLKPGHYLLPSPAGAFHAVASGRRDPARRLLLALMRENESPLAEPARLRHWSGCESDEEALELLYRMQSLGWIEAAKGPRQAPGGALETVLPQRLARLAATGKALLADQQGFHLASSGFHHEAAEELSALSADLAALHQRHAGLLDNNLGLPSAAWALVDAAGNSLLGCWPLHVGAQRFTLVLDGEPRLNQQAFTETVWALNKRYAAIEP